MLLTNSGFVGIVKGGSLSNIVVETVRSNGRTYDVILTDNGSLVAVERDPSPSTT